MDALRIITTIEADGELRVANLPLKKGQRVELLVLTESSAPERPLLTADDLLASEIIGLWADRADLGESTTFARQLREQAQHRNGE
jgi:hypothetical protein